MNIEFEFTFHCISHSLGFDKEKLFHVAGTEYFRILIP